MNFILTSIISAIATFTWIYLTQPRWRNKSKHANFKSYHLHHSIVGILMFLIGFTFIPFYGILISAIGFGIFLSHGFEEMYFNHVKFSKAFFIFVTKRKESSTV